jgi:type II secretory pathway component GspD/PulD (secretin)
MKIALPLLLVALSLTAADPDSRRKPATPAGAPPPAANEPETFSSLDRPSPRHATIPAGMINFEDADVLQVLNYYQELSKRTVVRPANLPQVKITLRSARPATTITALQILDTALAQNGKNGITMIPQGTDIVKAVPSAAAPVEAVPICELAPHELPDSQSYVCYVVQLKERLPRDLAQALQPFAKTPNSILGIDSAGILVLRDYSVNVKRMLQVLEKIEQTPVRKVEDDRPPRRQNAPPSLPDR